MRYQNLARPLNEINKGIDKNCRPRSLHKKYIYIRKKLKHKINNTNTVMCKMGNTAWLVVFTLESQFIIQNKSINSLTT